MTKETEVTPAEKPVMRSEDREDENVELEAVEEVVIDPPEPEPREDIEDVIATQEDPRAEIYKRHTEKRDAEIAEETGGFGGENPDSGVENAESGDIIESSADSDQPSTPPDGGEELVEVRVYENVMNVPRERVEKMPGDTFEEKLQAYQKQEAVNVGMTRNAEERRALESRRAALEAREREIAAKEAALPATDGQQGQPAPSDLPELDGQTLEEQGRRYQEALYDDSADAPAILANMVKQAARTGQTFDEEGFRAQVTADVLAEQRQAKVVKAGRALIEAHPELNERDPSFDPRLFQAINIETTVVEREYPDWEPEQVVQEAYERIHKWKGVPKQPETMSAKQAEKRAMTHPRTGTQRYTPPPPPPRKTNADYVREERKRRGLE